MPFTHFCLVSNFLDDNSTWNSDLLIAAILLDKGGEVRKFGQSQHVTKVFGYIHIKWIR